MGLLNSEMVKRTSVSVFAGAHHHHSDKTAEGLRVLCSMLCCSGQPDLVYAQYEDVVYRADRYPVAGDGGKDFLLGLALIVPVRGASIGRGQAKKSRGSMHT